MKILIFLILILFIFKVNCFDNIKNKNNNENHLYLLGKTGSVVKDYHISNKDFNNYKDLSSDLVFIGENQTTEFSTNGINSFFYLDIVSNKEYYIFVGNLEIGPLFEPESFQINSEGQFKFKLIMPKGGFSKVYISKLENFNRDESLKFTDSLKNTGFITLDGPFKMSSRDQKLFDEAEFNSVKVTPLPPKITETPSPSPSQVQTETPSPSQVETETPSFSPSETPSPLPVETETPSSKSSELIPSFSPSSSNEPKSEISESSSFSSSSSSSSKWSSYSSYSYNTIILDDDESDAFLVQQIQQQLQQEQSQQSQQQDTITTTVTTTQESSNYQSSTPASSTFGKIEDNSALVEQVFYKNDNKDANDLYEINQSNKLNNSIVFLLISVIFIIIF